MRCHGHADILRLSARHAAPPPVNILGVHKRLGGYASRQMTLTNQGDIPCHMTSCSATKREKRGFREVSHLLLGNWLGIGLPMGGGE